MREAFRAQAVGVAPGWDLVLIAREPSRHAAFQQLEGAVAQLLAQARLQLRPAPAQQIAGPAGLESTG